MTIRLVSMILILCISFINRLVIIIKYYMFILIECIVNKKKLPNTDGVESSKGV